jgi:hypothetical protein
MKVNKMIMELVLIAVLGAGYSPTTGTKNQGGRVGFADGPNNLKKGKK